MTQYWYIVVFIFGAIVGSFLNVLIYRLHTGKSINGRSHCMSCGKHLSWKELFPLLSWILLKGRCWGCSSKIPSRYFLVELLTGLLFMLVWHYFAFDYFITAIHFLLIATLMVITVYDIRHTIIPNELSIFATALAGVYLLYTFVLLGNAHSIIFDILGALGVAGFFAGLWLISKGRWIGLGDAKLSLSLGMFVGLSGAFSMVVLSFWVGAVISLMLIGLQKCISQGKTQLRFLSSKLTIKSEIPFAPFLVIGFLLVHFFNADIFHITYTLFFK